MNVVGKLRVSVCAEKKHSRAILKIRDSTALYVKKVIKEQCCGAGASGAEIIFGPGAGAGAKNKF